MAENIEDHAHGEKVIWESHPVVQSSYLGMAACTLLFIAGIALLVSPNSFFPGIDPNAPYSMLPGAVLATAGIVLAFVFYRRNWPTGIIYRLSDT